MMTWPTGRRGTDGRGPCGHQLGEIMPPCGRPDCCGLPFLACADTGCPDYAKEVAIVANRRLPVANSIEG